MSFQFTENAVANRPMPCERVSCKTIIQPGEPRLAATDVTGHVKFVCAPCRAYYDQKAAQSKLGNIEHTELRNSGIKTTAQSWGVPRVPPLDFQKMRQNVNESQRQGGHAPGGRVTAIPLPKVSEQAQRYRSQTPATGYSANHSQHALQTSLWSQRAYRGLNANQIGIIAINLYVYEPMVTAKGQPIIVDGIKEGVRISSDISFQALSKLIRATLLPPLIDFCGQVPFDIDEMVLRDATSGAWTKVDGQGPHADEPYFGTTFLKPHPRKKDGGLIFSVPANMKPPTFGLVFQISVWKEIEAIQEAKIYGAQHSPEEGVEIDNFYPKRKAAASHIRGAPRRKLVREESTMQASSTHEDSEKQTASARDSEQRNQPHNNDDALDDWEDMYVQDKPRPQNEEEIQPNIQSNDDSNSDDNREPQGQRTRRTRENQSPEEEEEEEDVEEDVEEDEEHQPANTDTGRSTHSTRVIAKPFVPLDANTIRRGFLEGGVNSKDRNSNGISPFVYEQISFINLPQPTFADLIRKPTQLREIMLGSDVDIHDAQLRYDPRQQAFIGIGSFKTTTRAHLTFRGMHLPSTGLGQLVQHTKNDESGRKSLSVALKRPYRPKRGGGIARMALAEEENAVFEECKLLVWANSLLKAAYDFMDDFMEK